MPDEEAPDGGGVRSRATPGPRNTRDSGASRILMAGTYRQSREMYVNRKELVAAVADEASLEQKTVDAVLRGLQATLEDAATKGEKVSVPGFFAQSVGHSAAREGRNPATGATITIPARNTVKLTPGSALKDAANK
jgi:DNA-binding protein HU-beta